MNALTMEAQVAIEEADWDRLADLLQSDASYAFLSGETSGFEAVDAELVTLMANAVSDDSFIRAARSDEVLLYWQSEWQRISEADKNRILHSLQTLVSWISTPSHCFIVMELLGKYFANADSFEVLRSIHSSGRGGLRAMLPVGFEFLIRSSADRGIRQKAYSLLKAMQSDESPIVAEEAEDVLSRLRTNVDGDPKLYD